jgi:hypothetical protein
MKLNENLFEDYYSDSDSLGYKIKQNIDDKVNDIFAEYQGVLGIESGDISPEHSMELETKEDELSDLIGEILYSQLNYYPDETPYGESLNESDEDDESEFDGRYDVVSYFSNSVSLLDDFYGIEDDLHTNDFEEVKDWIWEKIQRGLYVTAADSKTGNTVSLNPDNYDFESDDAYKVFDDLDELSPLSD